VYASQRVGQYGRLEGRVHLRRNGVQFGQFRHQLELDGGECPGRTVVVSSRVAVTVREYQRERLRKELIEANNKKGQHRHSNISLK
jgi:hypothetical protein